MHACTHLCMCIQEHIHMDKLLILLRVFHQLFSSSAKSHMFTNAVCRDAKLMSLRSLYLEKASFDLI